MDKFPNLQLQTSHHGRGVAHIEAIFIDGALPGEKMQLEITEMEKVII